VPDEPGVSHKIFSAIANQNIVVDMICQNVGSGGRADIGFTVLRNELAATLAVLRPLAIALEANVEYEEEVSKVSIVGTGMRTHTGVAQRMFTALDHAGVDMKMITTGDIKISVLVHKTDGVKALRAVHQAFDLENARVGAGLPTGFNPVSVAPGAAIEKDVSPTSSLNEGDLAHISRRLSGMEDIVISDIQLGTDQGRITVFDLPEQRGVCSRVFETVAAGGIVVDMIVQNRSGAGRMQLSFSVPRADLDKTLRLTQDFVRQVDSAARVVADPNIATIYVLGVGMRTHTGVARRMFGALADRGINIGMINTSEVRVSVVVDRDKGENALAALSQAFHT
jgi:aspartate kinase